MADFTRTNRTNGRTVAGMSAVGEVQGADVAGRGKICDRHRYVFAGVCLRAARHFGLDPFVVRVVMIVLTLSGLAGFTIPAYLIGMFVFGNAAGQVSLPSMPSVSLPTPTRATLGWALVAVGAFVALQQLTFIPTALLAGIAAVVIGINLVLRHSDSDDD